MYVKFYYRDASGEVKEAAYDDLVHLLLYGKITVKTPFRRENDPEFTAIGRDPEFAQMLPELHGFINQMRYPFYSENFKILLCLTSVILTFLFLPSTIFRLIAVFFFVAVILFLPLGKYNSMQILSGEPQSFPLLLLPYLNCFGAPCLYGRQRQKIGLKASWTDYLLRGSFILIPILFWIPPATPAVDTMILAAEGFFFLLSFISGIRIWKTGKELIEKRKRISGLPPPVPQPFFMFKLKRNEMYHILKKKYGTREKGFCAMYKGMTFLLLSLLILFIPFYLFSFAEAACYQEKLQNAGYAVTYEDAYAHTYRKADAAKIDVSRKINEECLPSLFTAKEISPGYIAKAKDFLKSNRDNLELFQEMYEETGVREPGDAKKLDASMQEIPDYRRFHYLEDLIVMQAVFEKRPPQETLAKLDRLQQWITEDSFFYISGSLLRFMDYRLKQASAGELNEYLAYWNRQEKELPLKMKRKFNQSCPSLLTLTEDSNTFFPFSEYFRAKHLQARYEAIQTLAGREYADIKDHLKAYREKIRSFPNWLLTADENFKMESRYYADIRTVKTGIALQSYYRKYGKDAEKLSDLVPEFLPEIPRDPYTGQELKYRKGKMTHRFRSIVEKDNAFDTKIEDEKIQGVRVYSVGKDLVDDGGRNWNGGSKKETSDIAFTIVRGQIPK